MKCPKCSLDNPEGSRFCAECGASLQTSRGQEASFQTETLRTPLKELATGATFAGRYQVIEELGKGGMGKVYKVFDTKIKEKVALKLIKPEIASDYEVIERFSSELRLARKIRHKNVCGMFDLGEAEGAHFITMEYVSGEDLKTMIRMTGTIAIGAVLSIGKQVCAGLAEAHNLGVVHRDLKPQNIMIDRGGNVKIMDFGIARSLREKGITAASMMIGTPEYMSPEQAEAKEVDQRSDIYSLGIILYEMAAGRVPFEGETPLSIAMKHKAETPKDPKQFNPNIPGDLSAVIMKCLEKDKARRYQNAAEVGSELEKIEKGIPTTERVVPERKTLTSREITVKFTIKKLAVPALVLVALAVIAVVLLKVFPGRRVLPAPSGKPSLAILYFENISGDKTLDAWKTGLSELLITKLSQSKFIRVLDANTIYGILRRLNLAEARKYTNEDLVKVANEGGASYTLSGSLMKAGDKIIINLTLQKPQASEVISPLNLECQNEAEIIQKVDEVATKIKSDLNLTSEQIAGDADKEAGKITTSSPESFKYYSEARINHLNIEYKNAIALYEKAVALDPEFAMAYRGLSSAYSNLGYRSKCLEHIRKAFELKGRVSDREAYIIEGQYYYDLGERTYNKAIEALNKLLTIYPDDNIGNSYLSMIYSSIEDWDKAQGQNEVTLRIRKDLLNYRNLGNIYQIKGLYDKAQQVFEDYQKNIADNARVHLYLGQNYLYQGKYEPALQEADKAFLLSPDFIQAITFKGDILSLTGKFLEAEKEYLKILELGDKRIHLNARVRLAMLYLTEGRFGKAKEQAGLAMGLADELDEKSLKALAQVYSGYLNLRSGKIEKALEEVQAAVKVYVELEDLANQRAFLCWEGIAYLEMGSVVQAQKVAAELKSFIQDSLNKKAWRYYYLLEGMIELGQNYFSKAIENFNQAIVLVSCQSGIPDEQAMFFGPLADAYYQAGDLKKAQQEYEKIISLSAGRAAYGDIYAKSFYKLGKITEEQGDKVKAREYYQKFLDLWKEADPGIPEVDDAKKRLSGL
jgi:serine/threonine protein kinase